MQQAQGNRITGDVVTQMLSFIQQKTVRRFVISQIYNTLSYQKYYIDENELTFSPQEVIIIQEAYNEINNNLSSLKDKYQLFSNEYPAISQIGEQQLEVVKGQTMIIANIISDKKFPGVEFQYLNFQYNKDLQKKLDSEVYRVQPLYQANEAARKFNFKEFFNNEYSMMVWLQMQGNGDMICNQDTFWEAMKIVVKNVEGTELTDYNKLKIFKILDPTQDQTITIDDSNKFFNHYWANEENRAFLKENDASYKPLFDSTKKCTLKCIFISKDDQDNKNLMNKSWDITTMGFRNKGTTTIGRLSKFYENDIPILKDGAVSRRQFQIIYKHKIGFCLVCCSRVNPTNLSLSNKEVRPLFQDCVVELCNTYKIVVDEIIDGNTKQIACYKNKNFILKEDDDTTVNQKVTAKSIIHQTIKFNNQNLQQIGDDDEADGTITYKKDGQLVQNQQVQQQQQQQQQQRAPKIVIRIENHIYNDQKLYLHNKKLIKTDKLVHEDIYNPLYIGSKQIGSQNIKEKCLKIFYEQDSWKVECEQQDCDVSYWLKTDKQCNNFESGQPSKAFQLQDKDVFGLSHSNRKYLFQINLKDLNTKELKDEDETDTIQKIIAEDDTVKF